VFDMVESKIIRACRDGDGAMLRHFADRRMRARGYGPKIEQEERHGADPVLEERRRQAIAALSAIIEERAREGKPPIFAHPKPAVLMTAPQVDKRRAALAGPSAPERW
jgi:hypothetical protein